VASFLGVLSVAVLATGVGACAVVEGLSQYSKDSCPQGCEADGGADTGEPLADGSSTLDGPDAVADAEAGIAVADASDGGMATADSGGCGPLDSVDNCSACGARCDTTTGMASCTGSTCAYVCTTGHSDCNVAPPDTDGCECATPACCGSACETSHADGVGQPYFDCDPEKTYTETAAFSACTAYALSVGSSAANCVGGLKCSGSSVPTVCFTTSNGTCASYCWQYTGVYADGGPGTVWDCACPAHVVGSWN
jgi:hypothetical protein